MLRIGRAPLFWSAGHEAGRLQPQVLPVTNNWPLTCPITRGVRPPAISTAWSTTSPTTRPRMISLWWTGSWASATLRVRRCQTVPPHPLATRYCPVKLALPVCPPHYYVAMDSSHMPTIAMAQRTRSRRAVLFRTTTNIHASFSPQTLTPHPRSHRRPEPRAHRHHPPPAPRRGGLLPRHLRPCAACRRARRRGHQRPCRHGASQAPALAGGLHKHVHSAVTTLPCCQLPCASGPPGCCLSFPYRLPILSARP